MIKEHESNVVEYKVARFYGSPRYIQCRELRAPAVAVSISSICSCHVTGAVYVTVVLLENDNKSISCESDSWNLRQSAT